MRASEFFSKFVRAPGNGRSEDNEYYTDQNCYPLRAGKIVCNCMSHRLPPDLNSKNIDAAVELVERIMGH